MKTSHRTQRLSELIQRYLAQILLTYKDNPLLVQVTITGVEVAVDLSVAKVFFTVLDEGKADFARKELQHEAKNIRHLLAQNLNLRITPCLHFIYDSSIAEGHKLDKLIEAAIARDKSVNNE